MLGSFYSSADVTSDKKNQSNTFHHQENKSLHQKLQFSGKREKQKHKDERNARVSYFIFHISRFSFSHALEDEKYENT